MIRTVCSIIFGLFGFVYTYIAMVGAYNTSDITETRTMLVVQFLVFSVFIVPFLAAIGLGVGFLLEGLVKLLRRGPEGEQEEKNNKPG